MHTAWHTVVTKYTPRILKYSLITRRIEDLTLSLGAIGLRLGASDFSERERERERKRERERERDRERGEREEGGRAADPDYVSRDAQQEGEPRPAPPRGLRRRCPPHEAGGAQRLQVLRLVSRVLSRGAAQGLARGARGSLGGQGRR